MRIRKKIGLTLAGLGAGAVNGLFGAGGGMVLIPALTALTELDEDKLFPSSIAIILPLCLTSLAAAALTQGLAWREALPYLAGSAAGGYAAGKWGSHIPASWLHRGLGLLILWGGFRYLC